MKKETNTDLRNNFFITIAVWFFLILLIIALHGLIASGIFVMLLSQPLDGIMPWTSFLNFINFGHIAVIQNKLLIAHGISLIILLTPLLIIFLPKKESLYGDARWANRFEISKVGLFNDGGILLGKKFNKALNIKGQQHILVAASTASGKGVSFVIPNLLTWPQSAVVLDIKKENFDLTSGFRSKYGQNCFLFNPSPEDYSTHRFNVLSYIPKDRNLRINQLQKISNFLIPDPLKGDPMWSSEARKLFEGVVLFLLDTGNYPITLGEVFRQLHTEKKTHEYFEEMIELYKDQLDPICVMNLLAFNNINDKTRASIKTHLTSVLNIFSNPLIDAATSENDFDLRNLRKIKMTIYVVVTPDNLTRMSPLINLFFQTVIDLNTHVLPKRNDPVYRYQVMLLMDEFTSLGRMQIISDSIAFIRGYGLQLVPIIQSTHQLYEKYGYEAAKNMIKNFQVRIYFPPDNMEDAEIISKELGIKTVKQKSRSLKNGFDFSNGNTTTSLTQRPLMLPQEVKELPVTQCILFVKGCRPILATRFFYYEKGSPFINRILPSISIPKISIVHNEVRGKIEVDYGFDFNNIVVPNNDQLLTEDEIDDVADQFWSSMKSAA
jgi:type IV secretion system protein VirD4